MNKKNSTIVNNVLIKYSALEQSAKLMQTLTCKMKKMSDKCFYDESLIKIKGNLKYVKWGTDHETLIEKLEDNKMILTYLKVVTESDLSAKTQMLSGKDKKYGMLKKIGFRKRASQDKTILGYLEQMQKINSSIYDAVTYLLPNEAVDQ